MELPRPYLDLAPISKTKIRNNLLKVYENFLSIFLRSP
ncbi:hypothetical protein LEP1GSC133_3683 [Leptospira borgpetersenii serovar Pomona str. 200901868]|uniref:Uncharacterized protein n=1 Tax=Leptospira borgpetersenii serovar Pomona str. 200901868 TaxID=1192866 RepID=M6W5R5_LEPBO|nr:hypothetical protein LEP1GSC133_3683 [Leptospira borgpetersenii serovar Pomona str. 200901868]